MKIALPKLRTPRPITNEEAQQKCQRALQQKDREDYKGAQETMRPLWRGVGEQPDASGLHPAVAAEVLLTAGILTSWIGSRDQIKGAQEAAKNLITEGTTYFESIRDVRQIAVARTEIAYCYFREGELNEARIMLRESLKKLTLEGTTRARALLKLTTVEWTAGRFYEALGILNDNATLFQKVKNHTVKGSYHTELAIVLRNLATAEKREDYFIRAIREYAEADHHFKLAKNRVFRASVKNNLGLLLYKLSRYKEAHKYLDEARRLAITFKDQSRIAQFDETRAQVFIAQGKYKEAEIVARKAAAALSKGGQKCLVADALTTQGIALARAGRMKRAKYILQTAIEIALQVDARNKAGLAALSLIEEVSDLPPAVLQAAYERAREWLADSQSPEVLSRLNKAAGRFVSSVRELSTEDATEILLTKGRNLQQIILETEREIIRQALAQTNGGVTRAAALLGMSYQSLAYIIQSRHKDLLKERSPVRRRQRKQP
ncbi:MAG: hypothetical protein M3539_18680 [Acidobacteriota bacterium]|nr:hypothetical protein [Acidobacteriota bacterium]